MNNYQLRCSDRECNFTWGCFTEKNLDREIINNTPINNFLVSNEFSRINKEIFQLKRFNEREICPICKE